MKYLYLTPEAVAHFIVIRQYQSVEYKECQNLLELLKGDSTQFDDGTVRSINMKHGILLYSKKINKKAGLFFDYEQFTSFTSETPNRTITIFQKVLRFATRYFSGRSYAPCEMLKDNNGIIFPFPYTAHGEAYRVVADRNGYRNGKTLNFLSVYYGGPDEISTPINYVNLNQFYEEFKDLSEPQESTTAIKEDTYNTISSFSVKKLPQLDNQFPADLNDTDWHQYLTEPQKEFIYKKINGAERLEGAAGTGKTLSLVLKCIYNLKQEEFKKRYVFITHSLATKKHILELFIRTFPAIKDHICNEENLGGNLLVTTVQEWCIKYLGTSLAETEYLDKDAMTSKNIQKLYIESAVSEVNKNNLSFYRNLLSVDFLKFIESTDSEILYDMLQYEFGVVLKGRADGDLDAYKRLERPQYGIPCSNDVDYNYIHLIYTEYQKLLISDSQFDSDDIVLSALSSLNAPIWRRRREKEGFDACFIDETHLFNFNELSVFPFLNKTESCNNIIFSIDKSQFGGEIMQRAEDVLFMSSQGADINDKVKYTTIFRSSSDILNLSFNIMSIGSTLFNNFENPLDSMNTFVDEVDDKYFFPKYIMKNGTEEMIAEALSTVDKLQREHKISKADCLIISTSDLLSEEIRRYCNEKNKSFEQIQSRGDSESSIKAKRNNRYLIAGIDYVGGLEFDYIIIIGVDDSRVPPKQHQKNKDFHFSNYAWHRRMYVALTRARFGVLMIGDKVYGHSYMFENAMHNKFIEYSE